MKKLHSLIALIVCIQTTNAQTPSSCNVPPVLQTYYDVDIKHLALQRIFNQNSPYIDSIDIPQSYQDTIAKGLAAIFNLTSIAERDSVFDNYCIHQDVSYYITNSIIVSVDLAYSWTEPWQNLITTTGNVPLDNLLSTYGFTITNFSTFAVLTTTQGINIAALCDSLLTFAGVLSSEPNAFIGDGNEITYTKVGTERYYDFTVGYGDCPSGCTSSHTFKFKVYDNCSVDYIGTVDFPDPPAGIPSPIDCNMTATIEEIKAANLKIHPNPTEDFINIETSDLFNANYSIYNLYGQTLQTGKFTKEIKISVKDLASGTYILRVDNSSNNEFVNYRIIKK